MRALWTLVLPALLVAACAIEGEEEDSSSSNLEDGKNESTNFGKCALTRAQILGQVSEARGEAISRGFEWLDAKVPFSKTGRREEYRTDCSGFVSMCWELGAPGKTTKDFGKAGSKTQKLDSYDKLVPGDGFVLAGQHSFLFLGWNDAEKKGACVLEQSSTKNDMQFRVRTQAGLKKDGFVPIRADAFANDLTYRPAVPTEEEPPKAAATASPDSGTTTPTPTPPACTPKSTAELCEAANTSTGVECGVIPNGCNGTVDCSTLADFKCESNERCSANKCVATTCTPRPAAELCAEAKAAKGVECGTIPTNCGGVVSCDNVAGFGCAEDQTCGTVTPNKCAKKTTTTTTPPPSDPTSTSPTSSSVSAEEDNGDTRAARENDDGAGATPQRTKKKAQSGCSAAPGTGDSGAALAGLALALGAITRRRPRR
jgi:hypothetical protein